ncbi:MAG TPA: ATP-binding cassette domain-containing protein [Herpetosiphonaceae bacterium]|nr:ATP-binding cassette domain-containing protein [Herpetosiphonaceae bacterium]
MITLRDIRKEYGRGAQSLVALDGINLDVPAGAVFGVLGQSGAGKSTLIRCVNLLERPTSGSVVVDGQELTGLDPAGLRQARQRIGMIFQHFNVLSSRTVADNVAFPLEVMGLPKAARQSRVRELLDLVGLADKVGAYPAQLSGGQKQRVGIARALAGEPKVLLSDEATSALDPQTTRSILELLRDLNRRLGLTIMLITHEMNVVKQICDQVAVLHKGGIVEQGALAELISRPGSLLAQEIFPRLEVPDGRPGALLATLALAGPAADEPLLSDLARQFGVAATLRGGAIETVAGQRVGRLQVELSGGQIEPALEYLRGRGLGVEVHR